MALATWWPTDSLLRLPALPGFQAACAFDDDNLARLNRIALVEVQEWRQAGHHPYLGFLHGTPVVYGWVATREASMRELRLSFRFATEP
jgi:hypothetical protein